MMDHSIVAIIPLTVSRTTSGEIGTKMYPAPADSDDASSSRQLIVFSHAPGFDTFVLNKNVFVTAMRPMGTFLGTY